jgi:hypothetical protein
MPFHKGKMNLALNCKSMDLERLVRGVIDAGMGLIMPPRWGWDVVFGSFLQICRAYGASGSAKMKNC